MLFWQQCTNQPTFYKVFASSKRTILLTTRNLQSKHLIHNNMKRIALLSIMMLLALCSQAQIYSSETCFYLRAGESVTDNRSYWRIVKFTGNKLITTGTDLFTIKSELRRNPNYYEEKGLDRCLELTYNSSLSTSSEYVYLGYSPAIRNDTGFAIYYTPASYYKAVFNKDHSTIKWYSKDEDDSDYKVFYYVRVPKSEVLPVSNGFIE